MAATTLSRYFGARFLRTVLWVFLGFVLIIALVDFLETSRRAGARPEAMDWSIVAKISFYRVPAIAEILMPFTVLIGAMACYLNLSRRLELVVARSVGISAWQFITPALVVALALGTLATVAYNPLAAMLQERSKRLEAATFGAQAQATQEDGFWLRQRNDEGQSIINATTASGQGMELSGVTVFNYRPNGTFIERIEAKSGVLARGTWIFRQARVFSPQQAPREQDEYRLPTSFTAEQVREKFASPETVPFWQLRDYIQIAEQAGLAAYAYQLQYYKLLARPFLLAAMVLLAAAVSLRFFRFGGVQKMILYGIGAGFLLYILSKVTDDLSKSNLLSPLYAAWLPVVIGGLTGIVALLYLEDG
jgi:lipopolysaccharide export system permease protein